MGTANSDVVFAAHVSDVRLLSNTLRPIQHASHVVVCLSDTGLEFITDGNRTFQAHAYIKRILFPKWKCIPDRLFDSPLNTNEPEGNANESKAAMAAKTAGPQRLDQKEEGVTHTFEIDLKVLLDCLDIFGGAPGATRSAAGDTDKLDHRMQTQKFATASSMGHTAGGGGAPGGDILLDTRRKGTRTTGVLEYSGSGSPLVLMLEDNEVVTRCELQTLEPDVDLIELRMDNHEVRAQMILRSEWLTVVLQSFPSSCARIHICFTPASRANAQGGLRIYGETDAGTVDAELPGDAKMASKYFCKKRTDYAYNFQHVSVALRGLQASNKASLRVDTEGQLSIQCLIPVGHALVEDAQRGGRLKIEAGHLPVVDYLFCPYEPEE